MPTQIIHAYTTINQTLYLEDIGTTVKVWFQGSGNSPIDVVSAYLHQGSVSVPVLVGGHSTFQIPALGRYSDFASSVGFTLPGEVIFTVTARGELTYVDGYNNTGSEWQIGTVHGVTPGGAPLGEEGYILLLNFEGTDGALTWEDEAQHIPFVNLTIEQLMGLNPFSSIAFNFAGSTEIDTSQYFTGSSSLKCEPSVSFPGQGAVSLVGMNGIKYMDTTAFVWEFYFYMADWVNGDSWSIGLTSAGGGISFSISPTGLWQVACNDSNDDVVISWGGVGYPSPAEDEWHKCKTIVSGKTVSIEVNDVVVASGTAAANIITGLPSLMVMVMAATPNTSKLWIDSMSISGVLPAFNSVEIVTTETIEVRSSNLIQDECTVALPTWSDGYTTSVVVDPAGQYLFDASTNVSYITGTFPAPRQFSIRTRLYFDQLGLLAEYGLFRFYYTDMEPPLTEPRGYMVDFTQEGLCIVKDIEGIATSVLVVPGVVLCNENADWQNWQFNFDLTARTIEVLLEDVSLGTFSAICDNNGYQNGSLFISAEHSNTDTGAIVHMDYLYMTPGFGEPILDANAAIEAGQTITINVGSTPITYTFVTIPLGAENEIIIGRNAYDTANNIKRALNATAGAMFNAAGPFSAGSPINLDAFVGTIVSETEFILGLSQGSITGVVAPSTIFSAEFYFIQHITWDAESMGGLYLATANDETRIWFGAYNNNQEAGTSVEFTMLVQAPEGLGYDNLNPNLQTYGHPWSLSYNAWHTFKVECTATGVSFKIDNSIIGFLSGGAQLNYTEWSIGIDCGESSRTRNFRVNGNVVANSGYSYIDVTDYTAELVTKSTTSPGITFGAITQQITYNNSINSTPASTVPSFKGSGTGTQWGAFGDVYGLANIPRFSSTGEATRSGNVASISAPDFNIYSNLFLTGCSYASTPAEIVALLLCDSDWIESIAELIAIPGDNDDAALVITQWVHQNITYVTDLVRWGVPDYWVDPRSTLYSGQGDCEDGALLTASLLMGIGIPSSRVRVYFGTCNGVGHAWTAYKRELDDKWIFLDWLSDTIDWEYFDSLDTLEPAYPADVSIYTIATNYVSCSGYVSVANLAEYVLSLTGMYTEAGKGILFPEFSITGQTGENASGEITFPDFDISGQTGQGIEVDFPSFEVHATAYIIPYIIGEIHFSIPEVNATGLNGILCEGDVKFPSFNIVARTTAVLVCSGVIVFPNFNINAFAIVPVTHCGIRLNTTNFAPSEYDNFAFNSMCKFNGKVLCASANGIVEFAGDDDKGTDIDAYFQLPSCDYNTHKQKNFRKVFVEGESGGDLIVTAIADDAEGGNYEIGSLGVVGETQYTFQMNHSDRGSQIGLKIENKNGADFTINSMFATLVIANTLTRGYNVLGRGRVTLPEFTVSASG